MLALVGATSVTAQTTDLRSLVADNHIRYLPDGDGPFPTVVAIFTRVGN